MDLTASVTSHGVLVRGVIRGQSPFCDGLPCRGAELMLLRSMRLSNLYPSYSEGEGEIGKRGAMYAYVVCPIGHMIVGATYRRPGHFDLVIASILGQRKQPATLDEYVATKVTSVEVWTMVDDTAPHDHRPLSGGKAGARRHYLPEEWPASRYEFSVLGQLSGWRELSGRRVMRQNPSVICGDRRP